MIYDVRSSTDLFQVPESQKSIKDRILGKDDFLKMLVAQLHYQDPMNPLESTDFSAQLAQFSSVEQLENISGSLDAFIDSNYILATSINNTLASTIIGKSVKANGNALYLNASDSVNIHFNLQSDARNVVVEIYDANGNLVRKLNGENLWKGDRSLEWDGRDGNGIRLSPGKYTFKVTATDKDGNIVQATPYLFGEITGIKYTANGAVLLLGNIEVNFSDVLEIMGNNA